LYSALLSKYLNFILLPLKKNIKITITMVLKKGIGSSGKDSRAGGKRRRRNQHKSPGEQYGTRRGEEEHAFLLAQS
jgi:hypothetical protein